MMKDLSIVTVTYQSREHLPQLMSSLVTAGVRTQYEHIIVDNGSTDGTRELVEEHYQHAAYFVPNTRNVGFAAANHMAIQLTQGRYILFLNPDMVLHPFSLDEIIPWMDAHPEIGVAGCKLLDINGFANTALQPRRFPSWGYFLGYLLRLFSLFPSLENSFLYTNFSVDCEQEVDHVRGAFMVVRRELIEKLGRAFDLRYFLLIEDMDFCREVKMLGYKVVYTPRIVCTDYFHCSFLHRSHLWKFLHLSRSILQYLWKWEPWYVSLGTCFLIPLALLVQIPLCLKGRR